MLIYSLREFLTKLITSHFKLFISINPRISPKLSFIMCQKQTLNKMANSDIQLERF